MLFTSYEFIGFMFAVFALYYLVPKRFQQILLLAASYLFYFCAGTFYPIFILITTLTTYLTGMKLEKLLLEKKAYVKEHKAELSREEKKAYNERMQKKRFRCMLLCMLLNFGILAVCKYTNFAIVNINSLLHTFGSDTELSLMNLVLPMGISFYTFQSMGYLIDIYWEKYDAEKNPFHFALFVSFFPQLIQGPISRFDKLSETLFVPHSFDWKNITYGLERILWGYFKKMVIADRMLVAVNTIIQDSATYSGTYVLVGMVFYALELYADFTGGIDITIGIAEVMGIRVEENFIRPYFSKNIAEYWRRWHISMGTWFKDYIFYPMSIWKPLMDFSKKVKNRFGTGAAKRVSVYTATIVTWFVTGIWHGASWNFIMWGLMNGFVIIISQEFDPLYQKFHARFPGLKANLCYGIFEMVRTFLLMSCLRLFDCYRDVKEAFSMFFSMFMKANPKVLFDGSLMQLGLTVSDYVILLTGTILLFTVSILQEKHPVRDRLYEKPAILRYCIHFLLVFAVLVFGMYGVGFDSNQFIYNQF